MSGLSRRDFLKLSGAALLSAALGAPGASAAPPFDASVIYHGSRNVRTVALTFDDCWHPEVLDQLDEMLKPYAGFHLTFFAIGEAIDIDEALRPGVWKRVYEAGHEIGYHTYYHNNPEQMSTSKLLTDYDKWYERLSKVLGTPPRVHFARPPYDNLSLSWQELCRQRGMVATMYSAGYEAPRMDESMRLVASTQNGDIVQMHTYQDPPHGRFDVDITAKAAPYLAAEGFKLVTMSELYDEVLKEHYGSEACTAGPENMLTGTCLE